MLVGTQNAAGLARKAWIVELRPDVGVRIDQEFSTEVAAFVKHRSNFGFGLRRIEVGGHPDSANAAPYNILSRLPLRLDEHQPNSRFPIAGDNNLFTALGCGEDFGQMSLGVMDVDFHVSV